MAEQKKTVEATIRNICQATRKKYTAEENVRIVLEVLRGKSNPDKENRSIADLFSNHPDCDIGHYEGKGVSSYRGANGVRLPGECRLLILSPELQFVTMYVFGV